MDIESNNEEIALESLSDEKILECYNEIEAFLKIVDDEIKKTNTGEQDEQKT